MNVLSTGAAYALLTVLGEHGVDAEASKNEISIETFTARPEAIEDANAARSES